ncbi:hypothetical protein K0M31_011190, partial [Melipona bicolor]
VARIKHDSRSGREGKRKQKGTVEEEREKGRKEKSKREKHTKGKAREAQQKQEEERCQNPVPGRKRRQTSDTRWLCAYLSASDGANTLVTGFNLRVNVHSSFFQTLVSKGVENDGEYSRNSIQLNDDFSQDRAGVDAIATPPSHPQDKLKTKRRGITLI